LCATAIDVQNPQRLENTGLLSRVFQKYTNFTPTRVFKVPDMMKIVSKMASKSSGKFERFQNE
jgi:hypothetical protein